MNSNKKLNIIADTHTNVSQQPYPSTDKPFEVNPLQLVCYLSSLGMRDGEEFYGHNVTELNEVIEWRGVLRLNEHNFTLKELRGRRSTKGMTHRDGIGWLLKNGIFFLNVGGAK